MGASTRRLEPLVPSQFDADRVRLALPAAQSWSGDADFDVVTLSARAIQKMSSGGDPRSTAMPAIALTADARAEDRVGASLAAITSNRL